MAQMKPVTQYFSHEEAVETTIIHSDLPDQEREDRLLEIEQDQESLAGWYGRLSAPGYLDATDWDGPYESDEEALRATMELFECDINGDDYLPDETEEKP